MGNFYNSLGIHWRGWLWRGLCVGIIAWATSNAYLGNKNIPTVLAQGIFDANCTSPSTPVSSLTGVNVLTGHFNANACLNSVTGVITWQGINGGTISGVLNPSSINGTLYIDGTTFTTCTSAVTAAGFANKTVIEIPSTYLGAPCPANLSTTNPNIFVVDKSGVFNPSNGPWNMDTINENDGNVVALHRSNFTVSSIPSGAVVNGYWITTMTNGTGSGGTIDGIAGECDIFGTLTGTQGVCTAAEHASSVNSSGGTVTNLTGVLGYPNTFAQAGPTAVTNARGFWAKKGTFTGATPTNVFGLAADDMAASGSARSFSLLGIGHALLVGYGTGGAAIYFQDSTGFGGTDHAVLVVDSSGLFNIQAPTAIGVALEDSGGNISSLTNSAGTQFRKHINQLAANGDNSGVLTCVASSASKTFATAYTSTPVILLEDDTVLGGARVSAKSNTAFTVTCSGATDVVEYFTYGNPN